MKSKYDEPLSRFAFNYNLCPFTEVFGNGAASEVNPLPEPIMMACYYNERPIGLVTALLDAGAGHSRDDAAVRDAAFMAANQGNAAPLREVGCRKLNPGLKNISCHTCHQTRFRPSFVELNGLP